MLRSLFSSATGLKSHQAKIDVISSNIANVSTYGFKSFHTTFRNVYYQTISSSTSASDTRSGSNASRVSYGTSVTSVDILNTRTDYATTGNSMDLYIDGEGYFVVQGGNGNEHLTRVGTFGFDGGGNLTGGNGDFVYGHSVDKLKSTVSVGGTEVDFDFISSTDSTKSSSYTIDEKNTSYIEGYTFKAVDGGTSAAEGMELDLIQKTITVTLWTTNTTKEKLQSMLQTDTWQATGEASTGLGLAIKDSSGNALKRVDGAMNLQWADVLKLAQVKVDGVADASTKNDVIKATTDKIAEEATFEGNGSGSAALKKTINSKDEMKGIAVGVDGMVMGENIDGTIQIIGKIAIADVSNPDALQYEGSSHYEAVNNTGVITYTTPDGSSTGVLRSGDLEMSNVGLANEFFDTIMAQGGFQANSKMVTVGGEVLGTLVNLKQ